MPVQSRDVMQVQTLEWHLARAVALSGPEIDAIGQLAKQLDGVPVMPVLGAGASYDCGTRLARDVAADMHAEYMADPSYTPRPSNHGDFTNDLGAVADAVHMVHGQRSVVTALGLHDRTLWPDAVDFEEHFCLYRVLARLARESLFEEALSFNYDCGFEAGLAHEGFMFSPTTMPGRQWNDHVTVITDAERNSRLEKRGAFSLIKAHGCASRYREALFSGTPSDPEESIIIRWTQLLDWRRDSWARDLLADRARRHVLVLFGFSGQDPVIHIALTRILEDVYAAAQPGRPRIVIAGRYPDTLTLRLLAHAGLADQPATPGDLTHISTESSSSTAVGLLLLTELLALRLGSIFAHHGTPLPTSVEGRLAALAVAAPSMLRWSFLLRKPEPWLDYTQRINLAQAARQGYVPLMADPHATSRALRTRGRVRAMLGLHADETTTEALADDGFVAAPALGRAYLPVGLSHEVVRRSVGPGGELEQARMALRWPSDLDCVLVTEDAAGPRGISIGSGKEVPVP